MPVSPKANKTFLRVQSASPCGGLLSRAGFSSAGGMIAHCALYGWPTVALAQGVEGRLVVPEGFSVAVYADSLNGPRGMAFGPDGDLYVSLSREGKVVRLHDGDGDGLAESAATVIDSLQRPHGLAWRGNTLWVAEETRIVRVEDAAGDLSGLTSVVVVDSLPPGGHWARDIVFEPGGHAFYVSIGSSCNVCTEEDPRRAAIVRYGAVGGEGEIWARGLRNSVGMAINPETGELWATDNGREMLGDDLPPEELNAVLRHRHYGWPACYGARVPNPEYEDRARCASTEPPILTFPAHTAPLGIDFYTGSMFPDDYRGDAFVALHGSWNRSVPAGFKVVRVRVRAGRPVGWENFVTGWLSAGGNAWGRPVQPLVGPDGALYVSDDRGGRVWRIAYAVGQ